MEKPKKKRRWFGLFRSFGWKKNLLAVLAGFAITVLLDRANYALYNIRLLSQFDLSVAVLPLYAFLMGGWGIIGCLLSHGLSLFWDLRLYGVEKDLVILIYGVQAIGVIIYSVLPYVLWYAKPLKGEERVRYPRMDTSGHVAKYYSIMLISAAFYAAMDAILYVVLDMGFDLMDWSVLFLQNLDVLLIVGMLLLIVVSVHHYRSITINERMVLAFLFIGVIASAIAGTLLYRTVMEIDPSLFSDYEEAVARAYEAYESGVLENAVDSSIFERYTNFWNWYYMFIGIIQNSLLIVEILFMRRIEKRVTRPLINVANSLEEYTDNEEKEDASRTLIEKCSPYEFGYGEVSTLSRNCIEMVDEINSYTDNLRKVTADKERIGAELSVASNIQKDMLPSIFPPFPDRSEIDIFASMTPAKEVGGDFYDFYLVDHDHLVLTIADVSGKGIPASLFMVISKTLLNNHAQSSPSPKEILTYVNHQLHMNNESLMFCTVWLGILDLRNGHLVAANAGHEYPAIKRAGGKYVLFEEKHDVPLALRDGIRFHEYELDLAPGDCLFVYTDGVTEATNSSYELFGEERLVESLNRYPDGSPEEQIRRVHNDIDAFVKEAPQFDDITMLCVEYRGGNTSKDKITETLTVSADLDELGTVMDFVQKQLEAADCPEEDLFNITISVEEIFVNIANYAYDGKDGGMTIDCSFDKEERFAEFVFRDNGIPFDPTGQPDPDITKKPSERKIGGLGIHIVKQTMDEVNYEYVSGQNVLTLRKRI